jgi:hypothetical protein
MKNENLNTPTNKEFFTLLGAILCLIAGPVLLTWSVTAEPITQWEVVAGVVLICLSWGLVQASGVMTGRREGRLQERKERKDGEDS